MAHTSMRDEKILKALFALTLLAHFLLPIFDSPLLNLFSDPWRHWENGKNLLHPTYMGSIDPKLYQLFTYLSDKITIDNPLFVGIFYGIFSAGTVYVWYRACREIYKRDTALFLGFLIGLCPSFLTIFSTFMNETLLLFMLGLSLWMTLRAIRKQTNRAAIIAVCIWVISLYCRIIILPIAIVSVWFMLFYFRKKIKILILPIILMAVLTTLASMHSYAKLNITAPFGFTGLSKFYFYSNTKAFKIKIDDNIFEFSSPSFYAPMVIPMEHLSCRVYGPERIVVNTANGRADWNKEIERVKDLNSSKLPCHLAENALFFFFASSWPDSSPNADYKLLHLVNYHLTIIWAPLILIIIAGAFRTRASRPELLLISCVIGMVILMLTQQSGVMEGRYRKPIEPLIIIAAYAILRNKKLDSTRLMPENLGIFSFIDQIYLKPVYTFFIRKRP